MRFDIFQIHAELTYVLSQHQFNLSGRTCLQIYCVLSTGNTAARARILIPHYFPTCLSLLDLYFHVDTSTLDSGPAYLLLPISNKGNIFQITAYAGIGRYNEPSAGTALGVSAITVPQYNYKITKPPVLSTPLVSDVVCFLWDVDSSVSGNLPCGISLAKPAEECSFSSGSNAAQQQRTHRSDRQIAATRYVRACVRVTLSKE